MPVVARSVALVAERWCNMAKDKPTKEEMRTGAADLIYALSQGLGMGTREPGKLWDLLGGTGLAVAGTNREGQTGVLIGNKFVPTSQNYYESPYSPGDSSDDEEKPSGKPIKDIDLPIKVGSRLKASGMKAGGLVRGAGKAERGRGRGRMV